MTIPRLAVYAAFIALSSAENSWPATIDWRGAYAGVNAGGGFGHAALRTSVEAPGSYFLPPDIAQIGDAGAATANPFLFAGGAQAGYNLQSGKMVYGLEADLSAFELNASRTVAQEYNSAPGMSFTIKQSVRTEWLLTVRPRVGMTISDFFFYGTAGIAATRVKYTERFTDDFNPPNSALETNSISKTQIGWTAGAGCEYALSERWSIKGEYLYADFGRVSGSSILTAPPPNADKFAHSVSLQSHLLRVGLNFKFYGLGFGLSYPPAAKPDRKWRYDDPIDAPIYTY